jgi:hypothetical protein
MGHNKIRIQKKRLFEGLNRRRNIAGRLQDRCPKIMDFRIEFFRCDGIVAPPACLLRFARDWRGPGPAESLLPGPSKSGTLSAVIFSISVPAEPLMKRNLLFHKVQGLPDKF